jgi:cation diffusion facilitator family transporter
MPVAERTMTANQVETRRRVRAVHICIIASFIICIVELGLGWWCGLASLVAEGVHTLLDGLDSLVVLVAVHMAARPADRNHQYGHGKFEALGASVEASFVIMAAIGIGHESIHRMIYGHAPESIPLPVVVAMAAASVAYLIISLYLMREARATNSPAVYAEAMHLKTHIYITGGLAIGLLVGAIGHYPIVDSLLSLGVAICLVFIGVHIFREVMRQFTDAALPREDLEQIARLLAPMSERFVEVHGLRTRQAGAERHIEMHLVVLPETSVAVAHKIGHEIEEAIATHWPTARTIVHIEPLNTANKQHREWIKGQPKVRTDDESPSDREFIH